MIVETNNGPYFAVDVRTADLARLRIARAVTRRAPDSLATATHGRTYASWPAATRSEETRAARRVHDADDDARSGKQVSLRSLYCLLSFGGYRGRQLLA